MSCVFFACQSQRVTVDIVNHHIIELSTLDVMCLLRLSITMCHGWHCQSSYYRVVNIGCHVSSSPVNHNVSRLTLSIIILWSCQHWMSCVFFACQSQRVMVDIVNHHIIELSTLDVMCLLRLSTITCHGWHCQSSYYRVVNIGCHVSSSPVNHNMSRLTLSIIKL